MTDFRIWITDSPAAIVSTDFEGGSLHFQPAVGELKAWERATPRLAAQMPTTYWTRYGYLISVLMVVVVLLVGFAIHWLPAVIFGAGVYLAINAYVMSAAGAQMETIEIDSRYITVTRGESVWAWPTHRVLPVSRAASVGIRPRILTVLGSPPLGWHTGGSVEWGWRGDFAPGSVGAALEPDEADALVQAIEDFMSTNPPAQTTELGLSGRRFRQRSG